MDDLGLLCCDTDSSHGAAHVVVLVEPRLHLFSKFSLYIMRYVLCACRLFFVFTTVSWVLIMRL